MRCSAWRDLADHCAQCLKKGMRVIATGRLQQRSYQAQDGSQRTVVEMQLDEIGPSLRYATAQVLASRPVRAASRVVPVVSRVVAVHQGYGNQGGQGGYAGGQGGYNGGYQGGGAGYSQQSAAPANPSAPAVDPWSNAGASDAVASPRSALPPISAATIPTRSSDHPAAQQFQYR